MTLNEYIRSIQGKRIAVVGIGVSNTPLIELLLKNGCHVLACDKNSREKLGKTAEYLETLGAELCLGDDYLQDLECDIIFRTPGMHPFTPELAAAKARGAVVTSEMEVFFALCPCRIFSITGSDGKTTTSTIISELLKSEGYHVHLGGNIGKPLLPIVDEIKPEDMVVLELSSFQLHSMHCHPNVAVVTNLSPNHLDVHPSFEDYVDAKRSIYRAQTKADRLVVNFDDPICRSFAEDAQSAVTWFSRRETPKNGYFLKDGTIYKSGADGVQAFLPASGIFLPGVHNVENYMAAFAAVQGYVSAENCRKVARSFRGVAHRLEIIRELRGVKYVNDSIASSPTRTIAGLRSFEKKPILIAGGYDKHIPFDALGEEIVRRVKALYLTGATAEIIRAAVEKAPDYDPEKLPIVEIDDFKEAVLAAHAAAVEGDIVLMSPACASFDKFRNFAERGNTFREIILGLE